jgi:hypothetical protein
MEIVYKITPIQSLGDYLGGRFIGMSSWAEITYILEEEEEEERRERINMFLVERRRLYEEGLYELEEGEILE